MFMKSILAWCQGKILEATDYGITCFPSALEFKIQRYYLQADHALHLLNNDITPMDYVVELLRIKFHFEKGQAVGLMLEIHKNGSAEVVRNSLEVLEEISEHLKQEAVRLGFMLECEISKL